MVPIIDVILILFLAGFIFYGLFSGLIKMVGYIAGTVVGAWFATHYYLTVYEWIKWMFGGYANVGRVIAFIIVFTLVGRLVGFGFYLLEKVFNLIAIIPFAKGINKLLGAILGLIEGLFILGLILFVASKYTIINTFFAGQLEHSNLAPALIYIANILSPLYPKALLMLQSIV